MTRSHWPLCRRWPLPGRCLCSPTVLLGRRRQHWSLLTSNRNIKISRYLYSNIRLSFIWPYSSTERPPPPSTATTRTDLVYSMLTTRGTDLITPRPPIFSNEIDVHRPVFKKTDIPSASLSEEEPPRQKLNLTELYQRLKMNFEKSNSDFALSKRYRKDDQPRLGFDNVNVVIPGSLWLVTSIVLNIISGRFNPQPVPNGVSQCKKDSSTNGTRVCSSPVQNNCQGGFKIGGNCNGQERLDNTKLPPSEFQMGDEQVGGVENTYRIHCVGRVVGLSVNTVTHSIQL